MGFILVVGNVGTFTFECEQEARKDFNDWYTVIKQGKNNRAESLELIDDDTGETLESVDNEEVLLLSGWDWYEYEISEHYLSAMINDDWSGLEEQEERELNDFLESLPFTGGHWAIVEGGENEFGLCDVSGMRANTEAVRLMFKREESV